MGREDDLEEGKETAALRAAAMVDQKNWWRSKEKRKKEEKG